MCINFRKNTYAGFAVNVHMHVHIPANYLPKSSTLIINNELKLTENTHVDNNSQHLAMVQQCTAMCVL